MLRRRSSLLAVAVLTLAACQTRASHERPKPVVSASTPRAAKPALPDPIRVESLAGESPPVFALRGAPRGTARLVFLHGICGHGLGYAQAFAFSAAKHGTLIAPQGDLVCNGALSKWSNDIAALDARIQRAFTALGDENPGGETVVIGMSQGATRAAQLVKRYPERYTRLIAMATPEALRPGELRTLHSAVLMAGERDRQDLMKQSARSLGVSKVPAKFMLIPQAVHGAMGPTPEATMGEALDWLFAH